MQYFRLNFAPVIAIAAFSKSVSAISLIYFLFKLLTVKDFRRRFWPPEKKIFCYKNWSEVRIQNPRHTFQAYTNIFSSDKFQPKIPHHSNKTLGKLIFGRLFKFPVTWSLCKQWQQNVHSWVVMYLSFPTVYRLYGFPSQYLSENSYFEWVCFLFCILNLFRLG